MDMQIIQKILQLQKQVSILLVDMSTIWGFNHDENKHTLSHEKDLCFFKRTHKKYN